MTYFYAQLFAMDTEIRAIFPAAMDLQRRRFFEALGRIAEAQQSQADRDRLVPYLQELGRAHRKFGVRERHYEVFRRALLATLQRFATPRWNETAKHAWEMAYNRAATIMIEAAKDDAAESPAWWIATVTGIELRGPDVAVLTLRPEQPLSYLPGQHISVQTPHWPRCGVPIRSRTSLGPTGCSGCTCARLPAGWSARFSCIRSGPATPSCSARRPAP
jgi:hemoglobin-like flavoprotein